MFKLYVRSYKAQLRWIRNHPIQYVMFNVLAFVAVMFITKKVEEA